jgi:drug/metabolite transporter (DMT)-like permease
MTNQRSRNSARKTYVLLAVAIIIQAAGNTLLSKGMKQIGSTSQIGGSHWLALLFPTLQSPTIWLGTAFLLLFFLLFAAVLSWADLSFVVPAISVEMIVNVAFAKYFLSEPVSLARWIGTLMISLGVILVLRSGRPIVRSRFERVESG